jgi:hypothetical protein
LQLLTSFLTSPKVRAISRHASRVVLDFTCTSVSIP